MNNKVKPYDHVFIVGLPRTGTKLMINILHNAQREDFQISPETFFVGRFLGPGVRRQLRRYGDLANDRAVQALVEDMFSKRFKGTYWKMLASGRLGVNQEDLLQRMLDSDRSDQEVFESLMQSLPSVTDSTIVGEKTPAHLYHVPTLIRWFPRSKIIHTFRDPRAIFVSQIRKSPEKKSLQALKKLNSEGRISRMTWLLQSTILWSRAARLHFEYASRYPEQYYLSRFEDLILDPEESLIGLCNFLNIEMEPSMLQPKRKDSSYSGSTTNRGFDKETLTRWRDHVTPWEDTWFRILLGTYLKKFGYLH